MALVLDDILPESYALGLDSQLLEDFGDRASEVLTDKRVVAVFDWLKPRLEARGYNPLAHQVRHLPDGLLTLVNSAYSSLGDPANIATGSWVPARDALFVGFHEPFREVFLDVPSSPSTVAGVTSVTVWDGTRWTDVNSLLDGTQAVNGQPLSGGGSLSFQMPARWAQRRVSTADLHYWARVQFSAAPAATIERVLPFRASRFAHPAALYALGLLYREQTASNRGSWKEKADTYLQTAAQELDLVLPLAADEFDVDESGAVDRAEAAAVSPTIDPFTLERG